MVIKLSRHIRRATLIGFTGALSAHCSRTIVKVPADVTQASQPADKVFGTMARRNNSKESMLNIHNVVIWSNSASDKQRCLFISDVAGIEI